MIPRHLLALLLALVAAPLAAQQPSVPAAAEPATTGEPAASGPPPPAVIPVTEIPRRAEEISVQIAKIRPKLAPTEAMTRIAAELPALGKEIESISADWDGEAAERIPLRDLETRQHRWIEVADRLKKWEETLASRTKEIEAFGAELEQARSRWERTRDASRDDPAAAALQERIRGAIDSIDATRKDIAARLNALLTIQNTLSEYQVQSRESLASIDTLRQRLRGRLLVPEQRPIWEEPVAGASLGAQVGESWQRNLQTLQSFARSSQGPLLFQVAVFLALWIGATVLRQRSASWEGSEPEMSWARHALSFPASGALLVTLVCTRLFHPSAPPLLYTWNGVLLSLLIMRLAPGLVKRELRRPIYALAAMVLLVLLDQVLLEGSVVQRVLLLAISTAALLAIWRWRRGNGPGQLGAGEWRRVLRVVSGSALPLLAVSLLANLWGMVMLARLLTEAILFSLGAAVVIVAAIRVLTGMLFLVLRTETAQALRIVRLHRPVVQAHLGRLIALAGALFYAYLFLFKLDLVQPIGRGLVSVLQTPWAVGTLEVSPSDILAFALTIWLSVVISRAIRFLLDEDVLPRVSLPRGVPGAISMMVHYTVLSLGFLVALAAAGIELGRFALLAGALGVGIGFGLQNVVNNFISGLILIFERPIQIGDTVQVGADLLGRVGRIGIRSSTIRTFQGAEVIVPNGNLISSEVINWTLSDRQRRIDLPVGVAYGTDPHRVIEVLQAVPSRFDEVLKTPDAPVAHFRGFGDSSLDFELRYWTASEHWMQLRSNVVLAVHDALRDAGIEIPFPQRDLHLRSVDEEAGRRLGRASGKPEDDDPSAGAR